LSESHADPEMPTLLETSVYCFGNHRSTTSL
jgi:hypothetical protein